MVHLRAACLFPVRALSTVFRAKYLAGLHHAFQAGELRFAAGTTPLADAARFAAPLRDCDGAIIPGVFARPCGRRSGNRCSGFSGRDI